MRAGDDGVRVNIHEERGSIVLLEMILQDLNEDIQFARTHVGPFVQSFRRSLVTAVVMGRITDSMSQCTTHGKIKILQYKQLVCV